MFFALGTYQFQGIKLPQSFSISHEKNYGQTPIIVGKPIVQQTGDKLLEITIQASFHVDFCTPNDEFDKLEAIRSSAIVSKLVDGTGKNYGDFVITKLDKTAISALDNGYITYMQVNISLLEYNTNATASAKTGSALSSQSPVAATAVSESATPASTIYGNISSGLTSANSASTLIKANTSPSTGMYSKISTLATSAKTSFDTANSQVQNTKKMVYRTLDLQNILTNAGTALTDIKTACTLKKPSDLLIANTKLESAVNSMSGARAPIAAFIGSKEAGS